MKKPKRVKTGYLVELMWMDSIATYGWQHEVDHTNLAIRSVGIVVDVNERTLTITTSVTAYAAFDSPLSIPWCSITKFKQHSKIVESKGLTK
jgi:hypothetical protein